MSSRFCKVIDLSATDRSELLSRFSRSATFSDTPPHQRDAVRVHPAGEISSSSGPGHSMCAASPTAVPQVMLGVKRFPPTVQSEGRRGKIKISFLKKPEMVVPLRVWEEA